MGLIIRDGGLLLEKGGLSAECCCDRYWCVESSTAEPGPCEQTQYECLQSAARPPNVVAGPFKTEEECECPDLPPCCETDSDCPENYCCEEGDCVPCSDPPPPPPPPPEDEYNCCLDSSQDPNQEDTGPPRCVRGPCLDANGIEAPALRVGGPYRTPQQCAAECRAHDCAPSPCCNTPECVPAAEGPYVTLEKCRERCSGPGTACVIGTDGNFPFVGGVVAGAGDAVLPFTVSCGKGVALGGNIAICVRYVSLKCSPMRFQIVADELDSEGNCIVIAEDVVKVDSKWKGKYECCPDLEGDLSPAPDDVCTGLLRWNTKAAGVTRFFIRVFAPCPVAGYDMWQLTVKCTDGARGECDDPCNGVEPPCPDENCQCEGECGFYWAGALEGWVFVDELEACNIANPGLGDNPGDPCACPIRKQGGILTRSPNTLDACNNLYQIYPVLFDNQVAGLAAGIYYETFDANGSTGIQRLADLVEGTWITTDCGDQCGIPEAGAAP